MIVRELVAVLGFKVDKGQEKKVTGSLDKLKKAALALAAAFVTGKLVRGINNLVNETAQLGDTIAKTAKQIGVNAVALQELQFAANLAGASNQEVSTGLRVLQKNMLEAADGVKSYVEDFDRLGVSVTNADGTLKSVEELLPELADGFRGLTTDTERTALAQTLMGRAGTKLIPLLNQGTEAINKQRLRVAELGAVFSKRLLGLSEKLIDAQREQEGAFQGVRNMIAEILLPIWIDFTDATRDLAIQLRGPMSRAVGVVLEILRGMVRVLRTVVTGWILITDVIADAAKEFLGIDRQLTKVLITLAILVAILGLPAVLLGLISAAILIVIDDLNAMGAGGNSVTGTLITGFEGLIEEFGSVGAAIREIFITAIASWFGLSKETADNIRKTLDGIWEDIIKLWTADLGEFFQFMFGRFKVIGDFISGIFGDDETVARIETSTKAAAPGAAAGPSAIGAGAGVGPLVEPQFPVGGGPIVLPLPAVGVGGSSVSLVQEGSTIEININGAGAPEQVASTAADKVEAVLERKNRQALLQLTTAGSTP